MFLLKTFLAPRLDIASMLPLLFPAAPQVWIILRSNSYASFCIKAKAWRFQYCVGTLADSIMRYLLLMIQLSYFTYKNSGYGSCHQLDSSGSCTLAAELCHMCTTMSGFYPSTFFYSCFSPKIQLGATRSIACTSFVCSGSILS